MNAEQLTFFASLDFPGRTTLMLGEIAEKLGCTVQHLLNQVEEGALVALDLKGAKANRRNIKVPVECYRDFIIRKLTGPVSVKAAFLETLPRATLVELVHECQRLLKGARP